MFDLGAESGEALGMLADGFERIGAGLRDAGARVRDEVGHQAVEDALESFVELEFIRRSGVETANVAVEAVEDLDPGGNLVDGEEVGLAAVVEVGSVVGDFVGQINELRLERGALVEQILGEFGMLVGIVIARVLDDALAHFEGQIEAAKRGVAQLEVFDDAQGVQVVVEEKTVLAHGGVEGFFSGVTEGRMTKVVDEGESLDQIGVEREFSGDGARDLRDFDGVGEAVAEMIGVAAREDLSFGFEAAEGTGMNDAVAVALEVVAVGMGRLGMTASEGAFDPDGVGGEGGDGGQWFVVRWPVASCQCSAGTGRSVASSQ